MGRLQYKSSWKPFVFTWEYAPDQPDCEMFDSRDEGRAKAVIYHTFRKLSTTYHSALIVILK